MTYVKNIFRAVRPAEGQSDLRGVSDREGHYDIDGVSFEKGIGVIVASDGFHFRPVPRRIPDKMAERKDILSGPGVFHD